MKHFVQPPEIIESTQEYFLGRISRKSQAVYLTVLIAFAGTILALPFVKVNVTVIASGILRPLAERTEIKPLTTGIIERIYIAEGEHVDAGKALFSLRTDLVENKLRLQNLKSDYINSQVADLEILVSSAPEKALTNAIYIQQYAEYDQKLKETLNRKEKAKKEFDRNKVLFEKAVIAEKEIDDYRYELSRIDQELKVLTLKQLSIWRKELQDKTSQLIELKSDKNQLSREKEYSTVRSPVSGSVEQFAGVYPGSVVELGQTLCLVSPDTAMIAEVMVFPKDIGWLSVGNSVNLQIDAFNYSDWGMVRGEILDISNDFQLLNKTPVFKVRCKLYSQVLTQKTGIHGVLKKGMTLNARFFVAERSLLQLLTDKANDWLNPALHRKQYEEKDKN